jgi:hypothetical protein
MADLIILAEIAEEITASYKDGTGTTLTHKRRFLSEMGVIAGNDRFSSGLANPQFPFQAVYPAFTRAEAASLHQGHRLTNPF